MGEVRPCGLGVGGNYVIHNFLIFPLNALKTSGKHVFKGHEKGALRRHGLSWQLILRKSLETLM